MKMHVTLSMDGPLLMTKNERVELCRNAWWVQRFDKVLVTCKHVVKKISFNSSFLEIHTNTVTTNCDERSAG